MHKIRQILSKVAGTCR